MTAKIGLAAMMAVGEPAATVTSTNCLRNPTRREQQPRRPPTGIAKTIR
jgi:hypothetical protein